MAALPAVVLLGQICRHLVVADSDQRLDVVGEQLIDHILVELEAFLVGLGLVAGRENARPGDGEAEDAKAHLGHECDILAPVMVEVYGLMAGIVLVVKDGGLGTLGEGLAHKEAAVDARTAAVGHGERDLTRLDLVAIGLVVAGQKTAAALAKTALILKIGSGAAPEKAIGNVQVAHVRSNHRNMRDTFI